MKLLSHLFIVIAALILFLLGYVLMEIFKGEVLHPLLPFLTSMLNDFTNELQLKLGTRIKPLYFNAIVLGVLLLVFVTLSWKIRKKI